MSIAQFYKTENSIVSINPTYISLFDINFKFNEHNDLYEDMIFNCFKYTLKHDRIFLYFHYNETTNISNYIKSFYNLKEISIEQHNTNGIIYKKIDLSLFKFKTFKITQDHNLHNDLNTIYFELLFSNFNEQ